MVCRLGCKKQEHVPTECSAGVWLGVGDVSSQSFLAIEYTRASAKAYDATTLPALSMVVVGLTMIGREPPVRRRRRGAAQARFAGAFEAAAEAVKVRIKTNAQVML